MVRNVVTAAELGLADPTSINAAIAGATSAHFGLSNPILPFYLSSHRGAHQTTGVHPNRNILCLTSTAVTEAGDIKQ
jgi:hypothetical protein